MFNFKVGMALVIDILAASFLVLHAYLARDTSTGCINVMLCMKGGFLLSSGTLFPL